VHDAQSSSIEADIARLETGLRQLKIQYDMFFAGALPREPIELRNELGQLIRRTSSMPIRKYAHRFHLNTLVGRFNTMAELWGKTLRSREEGDRPPAQLADRAAARQEGICRIGPDDGSDNGNEFALRRLHREFLDARHKADPSAKDVRYETFVKGITSQADSLRAKAHCTDVELRIVVRDGAVRLKARPARS
jgi:hypothetical protein